MLQFVIDMKTKNEDTESFLKALVGACKRKSVEYDVVTQGELFDVESPYVLLEPCEMSSGWECLNPLLDMDNHATSRVILDKVEGYAGSHNSLEVLVIGRGKVVGLSTTGLLIERTNCQVSVVNSHCYLNALVSKIEKSDIIVNASTSRIMCDVSVEDKFIIDVNDNFLFKDQCGLHLGQRDIGRATVTKILHTYELYMKDKSEESYTILGKKIL